MRSTPNENHAHTPHWHDLVTTHRKLVFPTVGIVAQHAPRHVDRRDLAQAGMLGLIDAARRYAPTENVPFAAYALVRIRGAIIDAMRRDDWAPRGVRAQVRDVHDAYDTLSAVLHRQPSHAEIAALLGWETAQVARVVADGHRSQISSLAAATYGRYESAGSLWQADADSPEQHVIDSERRDALTFALTFLPDELNQVVQLRFVHGWTLARIADALNITDARVAQLVKESLNMLRALLKEYDSQIPTVAKDAAGALRRSKAVANARAVRLAQRGERSSKHRTITHKATNTPRL